MMKKLSFILSVLMLLSCLPGCAEKTLPKERPEDFSFSLTWGVYGISSYDSRTGKLVKTKDATKPRDYVTYLHLSDETVDYIYGLLLDLNIDSYPEKYDPDKHLACDPSSELTLTVRVDGKTKTVEVDDMSASRLALIGKAGKYIETCIIIRDLLTASDEWKALPDYEFYYD